MIIERQAQNIQSIQSNQASLFINDPEYYKSSKENQIIIFDKNKSIFFNDIPIQIQNNHNINNDQNNSKEEDSFFQLKWNDINQTIKKLMLQPLIQLQIQQQQSSSSSKQKAGNNNFNFNNYKNKTKRIFSSSSYYCSSLSKYSTTYLLSVCRQSLEKLIIHGYQDLLKSFIIKNLYQICSQIVKIINTGLLQNINNQNNDKRIDQNKQRRENGEDLEMEKQVEALRKYKQQQKQKKLLSGTTATINQNKKKSNNRQFSLSFQKQDYEKNQSISNILTNLTSYLNKLQPNLHILSTIFQKLYTREEFKKRFFKSLYNQIMNNHLLCQEIGKQFYESVFRFRITNMKINNQIKSYQKSNIMAMEAETENMKQIQEENKNYQKQLQKIKIIKKIGLFELFQAEFLDKSKNFYIHLGSQIPKTIQIFKQVDRYLKKQQTLNQILKPSQNTLYYAQKELIQQSYYGMLQYFDYLIQIDEISKDNLNQSKNNNINDNNKYSQELKLLWNFTKRLGVQQQIQQRLKLIVSDFKQYISQQSKQTEINQINQVNNKQKHQYQQQQQQYQSENYKNLTKLPILQNHLKKIISIYFNNQRKLHSVLHQTIDQIISNKQYQFNLLLIKLILNINNYINNQSNKQDHQMKNQNKRNNIINSYIFKNIYQLFKITTNKTQFISLFQKQFGKYIIFNCRYGSKNKSTQIISKIQQNQIQDKFPSIQTLQFHDAFINIMAKQCGLKNCQDICQMMGDIFNGQKIINHSYNKIKCYMLGNYWFIPSNSPNYNYSSSLNNYHNSYLSIYQQKINLPEELQELKDQFLSRYQAQHAPTTGLKFQWCHQFNFLIISFYGYQCRVSEIQTCILLRLDKSIRPMTAVQLSQVFEVRVEMIEKNLKILEQNKMIVSLGSSQGKNVLAYELNQNFEKDFKELNKYAKNLNKRFYEFYPDMNRMTKLLNNQLQEQVGASHTHQHSHSQQHNHPQQTALMKDYSIIIQAAIMKILKNRKSLQKPQLSDLVQKTVKNFKPSQEQITHAITILGDKNQISIDTKKGIIKYIQ